MNILIPDDYQNAIQNLECFKMLQGHNVTVLNKPLLTVPNVSKILDETEALVLIRERVKADTNLLQKLPKLKIISQTGKISSHIDLVACTKNKIAVAEGTGSPIATAELTWSLILNSYRQILQAVEDMKKGLWQTNIGRSVCGQTIGIWGYGRIGKRIASYAKAFEMKVIVWGSEASRKNAETDGFMGAASKEEFFRNVDILTLHIRLTENTRNIVKAYDLSLMKPDALLVNTSRSELIEENALIHALQVGRPGFAAIDVYEQEPVYIENYPLLKMPNVLCTPHLGYVEQKGYELYFSQAFKNILSFADGNPVNIANPEVL